MQVPFHQNSNLVERRFDIIPNVRDGKGHLIMPREYESTLKNGSIVIVNIHLKLYVFEQNLFISFTKVLFIKRSS